MEKTIANLKAELEYIAPLLEEPYLDFQDWEKVTSGIFEELTLRKVELEGLLKSDGIDIRRNVQGDYGMHGRIAGLLNVRSLRLLSLLNTLPAYCGLVVEFRLPIEEMCNGSRALVLKAQSSLQVESPSYNELAKRLEEYMEASQKNMLKIQSQLDLHEQIIRSNLKNEIKLPGDTEVQTSMDSNPFDLKICDLRYVMENMLPIITQTHLGRICNTLRNRRELSKSKNTVRCWTNAKNFPVDLRGKIALSNLDYRHVLQKNGDVVPKERLFCWSRVETFCLGRATRIGAPGEIDPS